MEYEELLKLLLDKYPQHAKKIEKEFQARADFREHSVMASAVNILIIQQLDEQFARITGMPVGLMQRTPSEKSEEPQNSEKEKSQIDEHIQ